MYFSEVSFYNNALEAVKRGRSLLVAANVPYKRPEDFLCEMVKTDAHMDKVHIFLHQRDFIQLDPLVRQADATTAAVLDLFELSPHALAPPMYMYCKRL